MNEFDLNYTASNRSVIVAAFFTIVSLVVFLIIIASPLASQLDSYWVLALASLPGLAIANNSKLLGRQYWTNAEKRYEGRIDSNESIIGYPPQRQAFAQALEQTRLSGKVMIDKYLTGFDLQAGAPFWLSDKDICKHVCVVENSDANKSACFGSLILQQMARGRASGLTLIDAKSDSKTLDYLILSALVTGRIEDLVVIDPIKPVHAYNFLFTNQSADIKAKKILLASSHEKNLLAAQEQILSDSVFRLVRALESTGLSWSIKDIAAMFSDFDSSYVYLKKVLTEHGSTQALVELDNFLSKMLDRQNSSDSLPLRAIFVKIANELNALTSGKFSSFLSSASNDLSLSEAISRGKIIYFRCPQLEDAEDSKRWNSLFKNDLEISIREINSLRSSSLDDPHLIFIDDDSSAFSETCGGLLEAAKDSQFSLLFGVRAGEPSKSSPLGLSETFISNILSKLPTKLFLGMPEFYNSNDIAKLLSDSFLPAGEDKIKSESTAEVEYDAEEFTEQNNVEFVFDAEGEELELYKGPEHPNTRERKMAWFDFGSGNFTKGRYLSLETEIPSSFNAKELVLRFDNLSQRQGELGLYKWIEQQRKSASINPNERVTKK